MRKNSATRYLYLGYGLLGGGILFWFFIGCAGLETSKLTYLPSARSVTGDWDTFASLNIEHDMIPPGTKGRWKGTRIRPTYITIHSTQNYSASADARQHARALKNGALRGNNPTGYLTWHFSVDDTRVVQHMPVNERGEHADFDGPGNARSIGIEMCENRGNDRGATVDRTARLAASLAELYNIPSTNIVPHYHWPRKGKNPPNKNCPHFLLDNGRPGATWRDFIARIDSYRTQIRMNPQPKARIALARYYESRNNTRLRRVIPTRSSIASTRGIPTQGYEIPMAQVNY